MPKQNKKDSNSKKLEKQKKILDKARNENKKMQKEVKGTKGESKGFLKPLFGSLFGEKKKPTTTQDTIHYKKIYADGICELEGKRFNKSIQFYDINYQLAQNEDKQYIFESYCDFLNYFDSTVDFQLSFINQKTNLTAQMDSIRIDLQDDAFNDIRREYSEMLNDQLAKGNNGIVKKKYITFTITADSYSIAKPRLERIESDVLNNFKVLGCNAMPLSGKERLKIIHDIFNDSADFRFNWDHIPKNGISTKDSVAPSSFNFINPRYTRFGNKIASVSTVEILAPEMTDRMLADFLDLEDNIIVNFHVKSIDQMEAMKRVKRIITDLDKMKIEEQKKAVRAGYDMDIIPSDLNTYSQEAKSLLEDFQNRNERMFLITLLITNISDSKQKLDDSIYQTSGIANKYNCVLRRLEYQQEAGINSTLPIGNNLIEIERVLTTSSTAIFIPFTTQELFMDGESLYYGLNALSNNMILVDRKQLKNPNGLILGTPGSGKSFSAKREITNAFLTTKDDIIIEDPEGEYFPLVNALNGTEVRISQNSQHHINPLDINVNYSEDENPVDLKSDFVLSLMELILGGKQGLSPKEISIIDRCVRKIYMPYLESLDEDDMPILQDLYNELKNQSEPEAEHIATALEIYVTGSLNVFNNRTNVDTNNRIVCYNIKELGKQLKKIGMLIVQDQVWNRVTVNREAGRSTRFYIDEFHLLLKDEQTANYSVEIWKRFRKWGGIPTGITQNVKDLLASQEIENILENSDFVYMLNQAQGDRDVLAERLNISKHQLSYVTNSNEGEGLLFYGSVIIPFVDRFPKGTLLYSLMTTKPDEVQHIA